MLTYWAFRLAGLVVPWVPPRLGYWLAGLGGSLAYRLDRRSARVVRSNLRRVLGPGATRVEIGRVAEQVFRNQAKNYFDLFRVPHLTLEQVERWVQVQGWERLQQAKAPGKGVIIVSCHFGNIDVVGQILAARREPIVTLAERLQPPQLFDYVVGLRRSKGLLFLPVDDMGSLKAMVRALRRNELVALAADRDVTNSGTPFPFFGEVATLPDGHVTLALRTGATIVMTFSRRLPGDTFAAYVEPPLELTRTGDFSRDLTAGMAQVVAMMEKFLRHYPDQWVYFQPMWPVADV
ncbi:MAG: hypothetical protein HY871_03360 [Chloroflexi bacterium]|nr:hypothetical protein [Chloroflexota bacterium]